MRYRYNFNVSTDSTLCYGPDYNDGAITVIPTVIFNAPYQFSLDQGLYQPTGVYWAYRQATIQYW